MDTRQKNTTQSSNDLSLKMSDQQATDSLIYNIMKKIQLRERLIEQYSKSKEQMNTNIFTKYFIHSMVPVSYACIILLTKMARTIYMKPGQGISSICTMPNLLFHVCVFISLNEYFKYRNIFVVGKEHGEEYRIYKRNVEQLMQQKMDKFSLVDKITHSQWMNHENLMQVFKYRLVL